MSSAVLLSNRDTHGKVITRISKWSKSVVAENIHRGAALAQMQLLDSTWEKFVNCQLRIEEVCGEDELKIQQNHIAIFEPIYIEAKGTILTLLECLTVISPPPTIQVPTAPTIQIPTAPTADLKLPRQELPKFDGNPLGWNSFRDLFKKAVHDHFQLSGAQKLQYLKGCLHGDAALLLRSYQTTDANYSEAWEALRVRYENERLIINEYIKLMFNAQALKVESVVHLRKLVDSFKDALRALKALSQPIEHWDTVIMYMITSKLDPETHRQWELSLKDNKMPELTVLLDFLECRCRSLEAVKVVSSSSKIQRSENSKQPVFTLTCLSSNGCAKCSNSHQLYLCGDFIRMSIQERFEFVKSKSLCINCLRPGHLVNSCRARGCRTCQRKHHTLLHFQRQSPTNNNSSIQNTIHPVSSSRSFSSSQPNQLIAPTVNLGVSLVQQRHILLSTAIVEIYLNDGTTQQVRALIDPGSTATFVSEHCVQRLGLDRRSAKIPIYGIGESSPGYSQGITCLKIRSSYDHSIEITLSALILTKLTRQLPKLKMSDKIHSSLSGLNLADMNYFEEGGIDLLIGADHFGEILLDGVIRGGNGVPTAQRTIFGWILSGPVDTTAPLISSHYTSTISHHVHTDLEYQLRKFWEIENTNLKCLNSPEENTCENQFIQNYRRDINGKFVVQLPFKNSVKKLGNSRINAEKSFLALEKKFIKDPELQQKYSAFIHEYIQLNHMELVGSKRRENESYYLPHHPVFKESSSSTKLRVVFDASRKTSTNISLNDLLAVGPKLQDDLTSILVRFRLHHIVFVCDISKMYRQFWLDENHQDYQRILWRDNVEDHLKEFRLRTVTYGTAPASFLATRCLKQISIDCQQMYPRASDIIASDFYVDDLMTGGDTVCDLIRLQNEITSILKDYGIELRKWASNSSELLAGIPEEHRERLNHQEMDPTGSIKTLGLLWFPNIDSFGFSVQLDINKNQFTKRQVLSEIAKIFDPLGFVSPTVILAKLIMQRLWSVGIDWDQLLPIEILNEWSQFRADLRNIEKIKIPRWFGTLTEGFLELHGFCDASEVAYSSVIYCRTRSADGLISTRIISSKTRVAPVKQVTLARLELCAAVLLSKQFCDVVESLKLSSVNYYLWSDSSIVLAWLKKLPRTWSTFVANRVAEVQELTSIERWRHVPSSDNPADIASRGVLPSILFNSKLWWFGPSWLCNNEEHWPIYSQNITTQLEERKKAVTVLLASADECSSLLEKFSCLSKLKVVTAYLFRFIRNCSAKRHGQQTQTGPTSVIEREIALMFWVKFVQNIEFHQEINCLKAGNNVHVKSNILSLNPFLDEDGILRVGGRLRYSDLPFHTRHQIILPPKNVITNLIIKNIHEKNLHSGALLTLATFRQRFWIRGGRKVISCFIHRCVRCFRFKRNNHAQPYMGDLPAARVKYSHPFEITGVDFAGPLSMRFSTKRSKIISKGYVCVFVCFSTKAIHLEVVSDLTSATFLASFRRFVGRRGLPRELHSDCGTNFVGASKELKELSLKIKLQFEDPILINNLGLAGTSWKFIPPGTPNFGGLWESAVKSFKAHFIRVVGTTVLSYEELATVLCQIEACLNSRPLCPLTEDIDDYAVLTPGHFLIGRPVNSVPDPSLSHININRLSRWQLVQKISQDFWKRWYHDYLNTLQQRNKWKTETKNINIGDLVLIQDERLSPSKWLLGRVIRLYPGRDNVARVASVKTSGGELKRPCNKLCMLPVDTRNIEPQQEVL